MAFFKIRHITRYTYASPVIDCTNQIMLYPVSGDNLEVRNHEFTISHSPAVEVFTDYFGNKIGVFSVVKPHQELVITSDAEVITKFIAWPDDTMPAAEQWQNLETLKQQFEFIDFFKQEGFAHVKDAVDVVKSISGKDVTPFETAKLLTAYIYNNFEYKTGVTDVETKTDEVWQLKAGVCQDFAHMLLVMLRIADIPARYVSGYICSHSMRGEGATHAWVEAYIPEFGWLGLDPTNNCVVDEHHVKLAVGRSFSDCTPVKGTYKGSGEHTLEVSVSVETEKDDKLEKVPFSNVFHQPFPNPGITVNSYRRSQDIIRQQQQQQQQQ